MKRVILATGLLIGLPTSFAASPIVTGQDSIDLLKKLEKAEVLTLDAHAMGKTYYKVNDSLCLFEGDTEQLSCNDILLSDESSAASDLQRIIDISLVSYDGSAMGAKAYFKTEAQFCFITNDENTTFSCN